MSNQLSVEWLREALNVGDELVIMILPPGEVDVPRKQIPNEAPPQTDEACWGCGP